MTFTLAMHANSHAHIADRLEALDLDCEIVTFDDTGRFAVAGRQTPPDQVDADYFWLSVHIGQHAARQRAFASVLACRRVGVLQTFNAGLDDPFYAKVAARGVTICNSSAQGVAISEYVIGQVMAVLQPIEGQRIQQAERVWKVTPYREISRTKWLIVGFGPIGMSVAHRVKPFGAEVMVVRRSPETGPDVDRAGTTADLPRMLPEADVVVLACSLNDQTRELADTAFFAAMKPGSILVNVARGGVVDDRALMAALDRGKVATAILDVFDTEPLPADDPLWTHPGVRLTPHTSFAGDGVQGRWDALFLDNIGRFARGEPLERVVDPTEL
jgi:phosphoglycerate dehydrogenase-like enzyme